MSSNQGRPEHAIIRMSDDIERSDFIREQSEQFESTFHEIQNERRADQSSQTIKPLIQRVPLVLYNKKEDFKKCFEPSWVALGPLHHGKPQFDRAEKSKLKFAAYFALKNQTTYNVLFDKVKAEIEDLRMCYDPEDVKGYDNEELAWMLFIDGCAVLYAVYYGMRGEIDTLIIKPDLLVFAQLDLFLLENQIPYRVLRILIKSAVDPEMWETLIAEFIAQNVMTNIPGVQPETQHSHREDYAHLLQRLREEHLVGTEEPRGSSMIGRVLMMSGDMQKHRKTFRSIKELKESGIHVKPTRTGNLKMIFFSCNFLGELMMPCLMVDDSTVSKFLNLIALEMCRDFKNDFAVTTYLCFFNSLIGTAEDVRELSVAGILHNYLGSDKEVADIFNRMSRDLVTDQQAYGYVSWNIHKYCNNPLVRVYYTHFSRPWTIIAPLAAIIGILLSVIQTYLSWQQNKHRSG